MALKLSPGCCCEPTGTPIACEDAVSGFDLDVSGVADGTCSLCDNWNAVWTISNVAFTPDGLSGIYCDHDYDNDCVFEEPFDAVFSGDTDCYGGNDDLTWRMFLLELSGGGTVLLLDVGQENDGIPGAAGDQVFAEWKKEFPGEATFPTTFDSSHLTGTSCRSLYQSGHCDFSAAVIVVTDV
jgi:hypothetical protein